MSTPEVKTVSEEVKAMLEGIERRGTVTKALLNNLASQADVPATPIATSKILLALDGIETHTEFNENDEVVVKEAVAKIMNSIAE